MKRAKYSQALPVAYVGNSQTDWCIIRHKCDSDRKGLCGVFVVLLTQRIEAKFWPWSSEDIQWSFDGWFSEGRPAKQAACSRESSSGWNIKDGSVHLRQATCSFSHRRADRQSLFVGRSCNFVQLVFSVDCSELSLGKQNTQVSHWRLCAILHATAQDPAQMRIAASRLRG